MKAAFLAVAVLAIAGVASYFASGVHAAKASQPKPAAHKALPSRSLSLPLVFEPNQGQTASQVKFLARGAGYGLFLTADEAVLTLRHSAAGSQFSVPGSQGASSSVIRMRLDRANSSARISAGSPLPGKSSYFVGNDPAKWHRDIPQFGRVQYQAVYPGVDLVYYGDQGQLEYDFRVAPDADPNQIALSFSGATTHIDSGDLVLSTADGDVRFRSPHVYQPAASGLGEKAVSGSFRQLADNRIGFTIGDYDRSRELVIDPILTYSTYLGGGGTEGFVKVAVDSGGLIYLAGSTNSANFPVTDGSTLTGSQNLFISKINPLNTGTSELVYSVYFGGEQADTLSGIAVDSSFGIYVAGYTNSAQFPTTSNAFQKASDVLVAGTHGFLSKFSFNSQTFGYALSYSTYLAGNGTDHVTGLAIDSSNQNAYVTGDTTSTNPASAGFPANPNGFQTCPFGPVQSGGTCPASGPPQFFASKLNTAGSGSLSMLYSTYFGGGFPAGATAVGGGIAVDPSGSNVNMYFTGTTNMLPVAGPNGEAKFPLFNAQQSCLNGASETTGCNNDPSNSLTDAFVAKINPNQPASNPIYSTYLGGSGTDTGLAVAVDTSSNAYVTGSTNSGDWAHCNGYQCIYNGTGGNSNAFVAKIGTLVGSVYPLNYFTYLGGSGPDSGHDIKVDSLFAAHLVGSTASPNLPLTTDPLQTYQGQGDAFVALLETNTSGSLTVGNYVTYLGGSALDQGTGIALDIFNTTYVAGNTLSPNFPTVNPYQTQSGSSQDAFVTKIGAVSQLKLIQPTTSPSPNPVAAGTQAAFTFDIINLGPDNATDVTFNAVVPTTGVATSAQAKVTGGTGTCGPLSGNTIQCNIPNLAACTGTCTTGAAVEVDVTPSITGGLTQVPVSGQATANGGGTPVSLSQIDPVVDFKMSASTSTPTITAGDTATVQVNFCPTDTTRGYSATITPSQTTSPSMVTSTTPTFNPTTVSLSGSACSSTTLSIATVARPVTTGSLLRRSSFYYAAWLPIGGLSLVGLGLGAGRRRRRWLAGAVLCVIVGAVLVQAGCGSSSSSTSTTGGTAAGTYTITINGSAGTGASHSAQVTIRVN